MGNVGKGYTGILYTIFAIYVVWNYFKKKKVQFLSTLFFLCHCSRLNSASPPPNSCPLKMQLGWTASLCRYNQLRWGCTGLGWVPNAMTSVLIKGRGHTHREDKSTVKTEVGNAVTQLQAKECQGLVGATEARKNQKNILS